MIFTTIRAIATAGLVASALSWPGAHPAAPTKQLPAFDHDYAAYGALLGRVVREPRVDYQQVKAGTASLAAIEASFAAVTAADLAGWSRDRQMAFWINAYNLFTLRAIVDHYPIKGSFFSLGPRNSIRQIDGVWTKLKWQAAGRSLTLDDIEHKILRPEFKEPLVHFALNCASVSCPVLASSPYRAEGLHSQLEAAARRYLSSAQGVVVSGTTVSVSSIFKWYGDDFVERFETMGPAQSSPKDRAVLGVIATYGPNSARAAARSERVRLRFLDYDWSLNDVIRQGPSAIDAHAVGARK